MYFLSRVRYVTLDLSARYVFAMSRLSELRTTSGSMSLSVISNPASASCLLNVLGNIFYCLTSLGGRSGGLGIASTSSDTVLRLLGVGASVSVATGAWSWAPAPDRKRSKISHSFLSISSAHVGFDACALVNARGVSPTQPLKPCFLHPSVPHRWNSRPKFASVFEVTVLNSLLHTRQFMRK